VRPAKALRYQHSAEYTMSTPPASSWATRPHRSSGPEPHSHRARSAGPATDRHPRQPRLRVSGTQLRRRMLKLCLYLNDLSVSVVAARRANPVGKLRVPTARASLSRRYLRLEVRAALPLARLRRPFLRYSHPIPRDPFRSFPATQRMQRSPARVGLLHLTAAVTRIEVRAAARTQAPAILTAERIGRNRQQETLPERPA